MFKTGIGIIMSAIQIILKKYKNPFLPRSVHMYIDVI